jgi:hypothetical protein
MKIFEEDWYAAEVATVYLNATFSLLIDNPFIACRHRWDQI